MLFSDEFENLYIFVEIQEQEIETPFEELNLILQEPIKFTHTYGHANDEFNNIADKLADEASKEFIL